MKREDILIALEQISDKHIKEAEKSPRKKRSVFLRRAVAAVLVIVVGMGLMNAPMRIAADTVAKASEPRVTRIPRYSDFVDKEKWQAEHDAWEIEYNRRNENLAQAKENLGAFFKAGNMEFLLTQNAENKIWSPINAYIGLAMTTELTEEESRQQVLDLFGANDIDTLRGQVSAVWESVYEDSSNQICIPANSLWLEKGIEYNQEAMDALAYHYYASVYQSDLGSRRTNKDIAAWINNNTGKFLKDSTKNIELSPDTVLALYSTLYFQAKWMDEFHEANNKTDVFHSPAGDVQATYMKKELYHMNYYWGENFSAVKMFLKNDCQMWFILPDEGMSTEDVLNNGTYMDMILSNDWEGYKYMKVNLSVPKFDVSSTMDLSAGLKEMGVTNIFDEKVNGFTQLTSDVPIYLTEANQSVRVQIDEEGVKGAVYLEFPGAGAVEPPKEIIDFVLDRPFLFMITNENIPVFAGCVNNPQN